ncbi:MAG: signal peptidase I [Actinobacteria bacterium]|nr:signal peptidase I [Actinomycetota bacterium]MCB9388744.1 signal peptidase I [Acidimicrobiia bacterium]
MSENPSPNSAEPEFDEDTADQVSPDDESGTETALQTQPDDSVPEAADTPGASPQAGAAPAGDSPAEIDARDDRSGEDPDDPKRRAIEWLIIIAASLLVAFLGRTYVMQTYTIPSESMEHTIDKGDWVLVEKLSTRFGSPSHGNIVVFETPDSVKGPGVPDVLIKRVIGVPGDIVEGKEGHLFINGVQQDEPYTAEPQATITFGPVSVGEGQYFMMGDNRGNSRDSTVFGPIPEDSIIGRARLRVWPISRWGGL